MPNIMLKDVFAIPELGLCVDGVKAWMEAHNVDFKHFVKNGISLEEAEAKFKNDYYAQKIITKFKETN